MQLNELIDKSGIETVSQKTNIAVENLSSLYQKDFNRLNRVKALGFLNILEREYADIDLEGLRTEIKSFFDLHKDPKDDEVVMVSENRAHFSGGNYLGILKWLIIAGVLYGIWHFYNAGKFGSDSSYTEENQNQLSDKSALKSSVDENVVTSVVIEKEANTATVKIETKATATTQSDVPLEESVEKVVLTDTNATVESIIDMNKTEAEGTEVKVDLNDTAHAAEANRTVEDSNLSVPIENLTINPTRGMLWYGFINIDTKQRREFMNKVSTPFELNGGRWILVTGHGYVDIVSESKTIEVADRVKHYFYIDSKEIREIDRKEFRKLNNGRGW